MQPIVPCRGRVAGRPSTGHRALVVAGLCLLMGGLTPAASWANNRETPLVRAIKEVRPAVVNIHSQKVVGGQDSGGKMSGMGTGVIVDERGYVLTNYHVIEDVSSIRVTLVDGSTFPAEVAARDPDTDLALLHIEGAESLPVMPFGRSDDLMYGETVVAIGNAFGYEHTITQGIISELHRDVRLSATQAYRDLIQTDASINPGNSGGPLINIDGEMIGLNVAIRAGAQGIGFAIPVEQVKRVLAKLLSVRRLRGTWHGIVSAEESSGVQVIVHQVEPGSPAARAGVRPGDKLVSVDGRQILYSYDVERALLDKTPRDEVPVLLRRDEGEKELRLSLTTPPTSDVTVVNTDDEVWTVLGLRLAPFSSASELRKYSPDLRGGMLIKEIRRGSPVDRAGLVEGDILVGMHQFETLTEGHVKYVLELRRTERFDPMAFHVVRDGRMYRGWITFGDN